MRRFRSLLPHFCVLYLFVGLLNNFESLGAEKITILADIWCPYNCEPKTSSPGYMVEILMKTLQKPEWKMYELDYHVMPWARALVEGREGRIQGIIGAGSGDREGFEFTVPLGRDSNCFYAQKNSRWKFHKISDLDRLERIGTMLDYVYPDALQTWLNNHKAKLHPVSGNEPLLGNAQKLEMGRIDAFIENKNVVAYFLSKHPQFKNIGLAGCSLGDELYIGISKKFHHYRQLTKSINQTVSQMKASGEYSKLLKKYSLKE